MIYCVVFDGPDEMLDEFEVRVRVNLSDDITYNYPGTARKLPPKMPINYYDFETYQTGYGKGFNDLRDQLTGEYNHYDPEKKQKSKIYFKEDKKMREYTVTFEEKDENGVNKFIKYMAENDKIDEDGNLVLYNGDNLDDYQEVVRYEHGTWLSLSRVM